MVQPPQNGRKIKQGETANFMSAISILNPRRLAGLLAVLFAAAFLSTAASAQQAASAQAASAQAASNWVDYGQGRVRLVSATTGTTGDALLLGLQYDMAPGWEIYWRTPGEAGFPTTIDWTGSRNISDQVIQWPVPGRFKIFGLDTFGYKNKVVLPIPARVARPAEGAQIRALINFLTCQETCVPHDISLEMNLPGDGGNSEYASLIDRYEALVPTREAGFGLSIERSELVDGSDSGLLQVVALSRIPFTNLDLFVEGPEEYQFAPPDVRISADGLRAVLQVPIALSSFGAIGTPPTLLGNELTLTVVDGGRAFEQTLRTSLGQSEATSFLPFFTIILLAFLGGLILNVMPCVLPVLSIKLLGVVSHGGGDAGAVRRSFLATSAGILFAFLALGTFLVILRSAGASVGWGIQFQQPLFVVTMILVITLFAANMWGMFEIALPQWVSNLTVRGDGGAPRNPHSVGSSFGSGVFATILATPCSAPFLGTAIGFALSRGTVDIYVIFAALGVGMSFPFLIVSALPKLATKLPKPGRWMDTVKKVMGVLLALTAVWLLSVLAVQVSFLSAYVVAGLMTATVVVLWGRRYLSQALRHVAPASIVALAGLAYLTPQFADARGESGGMEVIAWQPFDEAAIPLLVAEGKTVFVNVTAEWCITCQVNKRLVLNRGEVALLLNSGNVVAMEADWTKPDETIAAYLASFRRFGIPFNAIYGPVAPNGLMLPELLKTNVVMKTFTRASGQDLLAAAGGY